MSPSTTQVVGTVKKHGFGGTLRLVAQRARSSLYLREVHVWYELDLGGERPRRELPPEVELTQGGAADAAAVQELPTAPDADTTRSLLAEGAELWLAAAQDQLAFACWIFPSRAPMIAARGGWLDLPSDVVCLENSVTSPHFRGQGVAPAAWSGIADRLQEAGRRAMITKVEESNIPSRRAVEKSGFREVAWMTYVRRGSREQVEVKQLGDTTARFLADHLTR